MKILVNKGVSVESAITVISDMIRSNYSDYPILKNSMNTYITHVDKDGKICPDNEKEFGIKENGVIVDTEKEKEDKILMELLKEWEVYYDYNINHLSKLYKQIKLDEDYLLTANEKNRKQEKIETRKINFNENKQKLEKHNEFLDRLIIPINEHLNGVKKNNLRYVFTKYISNRSTYQYRLNVEFIFTDNYGFEWSFKGFSNKTLNYGLIRIENNK